MADILDGSLTSEYEWLIHGRAFALAKLSLDPGSEETAILWLQAGAMRIGRTILALLIALSVAMLPAAAGAGVSSKSPEMADMNAGDMSSAMDDCCPHKANPCAMDDCGSMATCALKCFSFSGASSSIIVFPSTFAKIATPFAGNPFSSQTGTPPFRPPRV